MQNPYNLDVTTHARALARLVYAATAEFPRSEMFGLTTQMRRAAVSIGSNIAEGCGREGDRELSRFCQIALGSASELAFQCDLTADLGFLDENASVSLVKEISRVKRMLARLIKSLRLAGS